MSHHYEITCAGFNGDTDETDHLVLWVQSPDSKGVEGAIAGCWATQWQMDFQPSPESVDFVLPGDADQLRARVLHLAGKR